MPLKVTLVKIIAVVIAARVGLHIAVQFDKLRGRRVTIVGGQFDQFVRHPAGWFSLDGFSLLLWFNFNLLKRRGKGGRGR